MLTLAALQPAARLRQALCVVRGTAQLGSKVPCGSTRRGRLRDADKRVFSRIKEIGIWASAGGTGPRPPSPDSEDLDYTGHGAMVAELIATAEEQALKLRKEAEGPEEGRDES